MMKIANITQWIAPALVAGLLFTSCSKDDENPDGQQTGQTKTIEWEVFHEFEQGETVIKFEISDDAKWLFYQDIMGATYRVNKNTGEKSVLNAQPLQFENGKLYLYVMRDYKSYFAVSEDFGATRTEYHVGTYYNDGTGRYSGAFISPAVNRLFVMPNGNFILPHVMRTASNNQYLADNKLIAVSTDGGATWEQKDSEYSYISVQQGNRLFALKGGWTGVEAHASKLYYSDNEGASWQASDLTYRPQAVDKENNLIAGFRNEIQKLKGNTWMVYTWDENSQPLVSLSGLKYEGITGNDPNGRQMDDIEFDADNNIYVMGRNKTTICRTKLN